MPTSRRFPWRRQYFAHSAFTLVELLIVIVIIGLLMAISIPAVLAATESVRRITCASHLKQMGTAIQVYHATHRYFPASWVNGDENIAWARSLLPYLEEVEIWEQLNCERSPTATPNDEVAAQPVEVYKCPTALSDAVYTYTQPGSAQRFGTIDYKSASGVNASDPSLKDWGRANWLPGIIERAYVREADVKDGLTKTILLVESPGGLVIYGPNRKVNPGTSQLWYPTDGAWIGRALSGLSPSNYALWFNVRICTVNCSNMYNMGPYSFHSRGANVVFGDASVRFLAENMEPSILSAMYAYDDGQIFEIP